MWYVVYQKSIIEDFVVGFFKWDFDAESFVKLKSTQDGEMYITVVDREELSIITSECFY